MNFTTNQSGKIGWLLLIISLFSYTVVAQDDEDEDYISPVRPTVSDSATIQKKGVLQFEAGGDLDFRSPEYRNRQAVPLGFYYAVNKRLRLDLEVDTFVSQKDPLGMRESGVGDVQLGFKAIMREEPKELSPPPSLTQSNCPLPVKKKNSAREKLTTICG